MFNSRIQAFLTVLLKTYFLNTRCIVFITDDSNNLEMPQIGLPFVNLNVDQSFNKSKFNMLFKYFGCQDFIIVAHETVSIFKEIEKEIKLNPDRFVNRKFIFISTVKDAVENDLKIFDTTEINFVADLVVLEQNCEDSMKSDKLEGQVNWPLINKNGACKVDCTFSVWTHSYKGYKNKNKPYIINVWFSKNESFLNGFNLFPNKLRNQEGRELKFATFQYEPYSIVEPLGEKQYKYLGSEMTTAKIFAQFLNMTFVPVVNEKDYWGEVYENWTGNGLMGNIAMDNADLGAAALYTWDTVYPFLELSKPTVRTGITCLVPAPSLSAGWLTPIYAFSSTTWIAVAFTFFSSIFTNFFTQVVFFQKTMRGIGNTARNLISLERFSMINTAFFLVFKPFVLQNVTKKEMICGRLGRFIMGLTFLMSMVLSAIYDSGFACVMTIPRYSNPINTIDDFVESEIYWGAQADAWITSIAGSKEKKYQMLVSRFEVLTETQLREKSLGEFFAFSLERLPKGDFAIGTYIQNDVIANFHLMQEDFYWEYCVIMTRRNSILLPLLDDFILRVFEAGLISVWQNEAASKYMNQYVQKAVKYLLHKKERTIVKLNILHVKGAFGILILGYLLGFLVFIIEILAYNYVIKKKFKASL